MKQARISDLKNHLSRYLDLVREGETIQVLDRDVPIAVISSIADAKTGIREERLQQMERKGLVRRGKPALLKSILETAPPGKKTGVLKALLDEREEGP